MKEEITGFENSGFSKVIFLLSIWVAVYCITSQFANLYRFALLGAFFEILWLPFFTMLFVLPMLSFFFWAKEKFNIRSLFIYSILLSGTTIMILVLKT